MSEIGRETPTQSLDSKVGRAGRRVACVVMDALTEIGLDDEAE